MARKKSDIQSEIGKFKDEASLTDAELSNLLSLYTELGDIPAGQTTRYDEFFKDINDQIRLLLKKTGYDTQAATLDGEAGKFAGQIILDPNGSPQAIADYIKDHSKGELSSGNFNAIKEIAKGVFQDFKNRKDQYFFSEPQTQVGEDVTRVKGLLDTRFAKAEKEGSINDFLTGLPANLESSRNELLDAETARLGDEFNDYIPRALADRNSKGLLFSGDVEDLLSTRAVDLQSGVESLQADLEAADNQFYFDAAYQNQIRKSLEGSEDYKAAIESERGRILTERENRFRSAQGELDRNLDEKLTVSAGNRQLRTNQSNLKSNASAKDSASRGQLFSDLASAGASVAATYAGSKAATSRSQTSNIPRSVG